MAAGSIPAEGTECRREPILVGMRRILGYTRFAVVVPAVASIVGALLLMAQGSIAMMAVVFDTIVNQSSLKSSIVDVLTAVDAILLGTVLLVIG